jgi:putative glutamine amidotransferase
MAKSTAYPGAKLKPTLLNLSSTLTLSLCALLATPAVAAAADTVKPLIGINCDMQVEKNGAEPKSLSVPIAYVRAIEKAGGVPILLPPMDSATLEILMPTLDGIMLIGGADYPPEIYGQKAHSSVVPMVKERADFDLNLAKSALAEPNKPVLGICAGCQALNIADGGTLNQDIASLPANAVKTRVAHAGAQGWQKEAGRHDVTFVKDSHLASDLGQVAVSEPTSHHQCVASPGQNFKVTATAADGLIEGIEIPDRPFVVGVQFHPEKLYDRNQALFNDFISSARNYREGRHGNKLLEHKN